MNRTAAATEIVGRDTELATLDAFLDGGTGARSMLLDGPPGMGKSTLWEAALASAAGRGFRILRARPSEIESTYSFGALADLLEPVTRRELTSLPAPQLTALQVALLREAPAAVPPDSRSLAAGLATALRVLAARREVLVAVDDMQWLDPASAGALTWAARRLGRDPIRFLLARRPGAASPLTEACAPLDMLIVAPVDRDAMRQLLIDRFGVGLPRRTLDRVFETSLGNPMFALEIGRLLVRNGQLLADDDLPLPDRLEDMIGPRIADLSQPVRLTLLATALAREIAIDQLATLVGTGAIDDALDAGLVRIDGDRLVPSHPLLAAAARKHASTSERRRVHIVLAELTSDPERRAHHVALGSHRADEQVGTLIADAAARAAARGATADALALSEQALRLTPSTSSSREGRIVDLAEHCFKAGDEQRVLDLVLARTGSFSEPATNARARMLVVETSAGDLSDDEKREHLARALVESETDRALHVRVSAHAAAYSALAWVEQISEAESLADAALRSARTLGPEAERFPRWALGWARILGGRSIDELLLDEDASAGSDDHLSHSLERVRVVRQVWRGDLDSARSGCSTFLALARELGQSSTVLELHLCELEIRSGHWQAATEIADGWDRSGEGARITPAAERCRALVAAGRGDPEGVARWSEIVTSIAVAPGRRWDILEAERARGTIALLEHDPARATGHLSPIWERTCDEGVNDPGAFPVAPDLVEALIELGDLDDAAAVVERLGRLSEEQDHAWGLATTNRCRGLLALATGDDAPVASAALAAAASSYGQLGFRFDHARTHLAWGRALRRRRKWGAARTALETAASAFDDIDSPGWATVARSEIERVGARRPGPAGRLTPAELRAAELAAAGMSNKEIASALVVSIHTVEVHLSHAYAKLGIRSRSQLAPLLRGVGPEP